MKDTIAVALLESALPAYYSPRFDRMLRNRKIGGIIEEGPVSWPIHNKLVISSLKVGDSELERSPDHPDFNDSSDNNLRRFQCEKFLIGKAGDYLAFEEWFRPHSKEDHYTKVTVFHRETGEEIKEEWASSLQSVRELETAVEAEFGGSSTEKGDNG